MSDESKPATALKSLSDAELVRTVHEGFTPESTGDTDPARERNVQRARDELAHIETLRQNSSFRWFYSTCIEAGFKESRGVLEEAGIASGRFLTSAVGKFQVWRRIARWLDERELEHRRLLKHDEARLNELRRQIDLH